MTVSTMVRMTAAILVAVVCLTLGSFVHIPATAGDIPALRRAPPDKPTHAGGASSNEHEPIKKVDSEYRTYSSAAVTTETHICSKIGS